MHQGEIDRISQVVYKYKNLYIFFLNLYKIKIQDKGNPVSAKRGK